MSKLSALVVAALLVAMTWFVFAGVTDCEFLNIDDPDFVTGNAHVQQGLTPKNAVWALTTGHAASWHPLTWMSLMLDHDLYGLEPAGYHATNLLLHLVNVALVFLVLYQLTGALGRSALVAALFAIHPLRVESVAWVSERKDVLCPVFGLLAIAAYVRYARAPGVFRYSIVVLLFALSLMSKPMLVTLPCLLLLLDYWPLGRLKLGRANSAAAEPPAAGSPPPDFPPRSPLALVLEKLPLAAVAGVAIAITIFVNARGASMQNLEALPMSKRLANAPVSYARYLEKMVRFDELAVFYPYPPSWPGWQVALSVTLLLLVSTLVLRQLRARPWLAVGWFWFLGLMVPVIGLMQIGTQSMADRYAYLPTIGLLIMLVWSLPEGLFTRTAGRLALGVAAAAVLVVLGLFTRRQIAYWHDSRALFTHALAVTDDNYFAHTNLGAALADAGQPREAIEHYDAALAIKPQESLVYYNRGKAREALGEHALSLKDFQHVVELKPKGADAWLELGSAYAALGQLDKAVAAYGQAIALDPKLTGAYVNRGSTLLDLGRPTAALADLNKAIQLDPHSAAAYLNRGNAHRAADSVEQARADYTRAIELQPGFAVAYNNRGMLHSARKFPKQAIADYNQAIRLDPNYAVAFNNRGNAYQSLADDEETLAAPADATRRAIADRTRAIELQPKYADAYFNRAYSYFKAKDYDKAWADVGKCRELGRPIDSAFIEALTEASGGPQELIAVPK